ncbi:hypothetical protein TNCV_4989551 [Trichonephila clavipes]|uniref:Uncharacterized protein n=1 Tax=Trichonephila clavipes TaxID=2585209 RepID=A0A8X7BH16_TRICX|nr:hypothetical protein TNCV_4989551 [Trichonephila clavipes]
MQFGKLSSPNSGLYKTDQGFRSSSISISNGFRPTLFYGTEMANRLAKEGSSEVPMTSNSLTFSEICSKINISNSSYRKFPSTHRLDGKAPDGVFSISRRIESSNPPSSDLQMDA